MKYIKIIVLTILIISISLKAQDMSIFSRATKSGWYPQFLNPVIETISNMSQHHKILDIGTGPGTLAQMLIESDSSLQITGIDIDTTMIDEAKRRSPQTNISFQYQKTNAPLHFANEQFDVVTFCSVLFLVDDSIKNNLMNEALRVLKPNGKIIILSPSGKKSIASSFIEVWKYPFSVNNFTFPIWKLATTRRARKWQRQKWLQNYAKENQLTYSVSLTFNNNASIETISKKQKPI
jgi:ubiquinone/menaquinone biosynthesis C-methylase UbiE